MPLDTEGKLLLQKEHGLEISTAFWFNYAHVSQEAGLYDQADLTTRYLNEAGKQGVHYMEALRVLDAVELAHKRQEAEEKWDNLPVNWSASPAAPSTWGI